MHKPGTLLKNTFAEIRKCDWPRDQPTNLLIGEGVYGKHLNCEWTPPALERALWGTFFWGPFEQICQIIVTYDGT